MKKWFNIFLFLKWHIYKKHWIIKTWSKSMLNIEAKHKFVDIQSGSDDELGQIVSYL